MDTGEMIKKEIWDNIKKIIPRSVLLTIAIYACLVLGGLKVYNTLTVNSKLSDETVNTVTNLFSLAFLIITAVAIVVCVVLFIFSRKKSKENCQPDTIQEEENSNQNDAHDYTQIDAAIVEQNDPARDNKFIEINQNVQKTYWVLGVSLTSIVEQETTIKKMAKNKVDIRLCMMNPDIAVDNLCLSSVKKKTCALQNLFEEIRNGAVEIDNLQEKIACMKDCENILDIFHVLINVIHFNQYYNTSTDYKKRIMGSYKDLKQIRDDISCEYGRVLSLKVADSFMPMSLTIADACDESGRMIVEFHLPFTNYKVLFEIKKKTNKELFDVFVKFYETIWARAQES